MFIVTDLVSLRSNTEHLGLIQKLHGLIRNDTSHGVCTADEERFATVQVRATADNKDLKRVHTNRH